jgi:tetratricopeptide (TPR) repeat protein
MENFYAQGNEAVRVGSFDQAIEFYSQAIHLYQSTKVDRLEASMRGGRWEIHHLQDFDIHSLEILLKITANLGFVHWKLRNFDDAVNILSDIIEFYQSFVNFLYEGSSTSLEIPKFLSSLQLLCLKSLVRRCFCYGDNQQFEKCETDLKHIENVVASSVECYKLVSSMINIPVFRKKIADAQHMDEVVAHSEGKAKWMSHENQLLRLFFVDSPHLPLFNFSSVVDILFPSEQKQKRCFSCQINCKLILGNELGLFNRSLYNQQNKDVAVLGLASCRLRRLSIHEEIPLNIYESIFISNNPLVNVYSNAVNSSLLDKSSIVNDIELSFNISSSGKVSNVFLVLNLGLLLAIG